MRRVHVVVTGMVQGVGFRYYTLSRAETLGVTGWVRNRPDGAVEVEVEGPNAAVEAMLAWLADGPASARVRATRVTESRPEGSTGVRIRH